MSGFLAPIAYVLAFVAVIIVVQTLSGVVFAARDRTQRVNRRLTLLEAGINPEQVYATLVRKAAAPKLAGPLLLQWHNRLETYLRQAGMASSPTQVLAITAAVAGLLWLVALAIARNSGAGFLIESFMSLFGATAVAVIGAAMWISRRRTKRIKQIELQLPIALDIVNRAIRAGHPVILAVRLAANELPDPVGSEFGLIVDETSYGFEFKEALTNFARRTGSEAAHFFAVSVSIQSETGGNLAEILEGLAGVMRGRHTLSQRVKALSSEGRTSAILISILPIFMMGVLMLIHPSVYSDKFSDPVFWPIVGGAAMAYVAGWLMVQRIINFRY